VNLDVSVLKIKNIMNIFNNSSCLLVINDNPRINIKKKLSN